MLQHSKAMVAAAPPALLQQHRALPRLLTGSPAHGSAAGRTRADRLPSTKTPTQPVVAMLPPLNSRRVVSLVTAGLGSSARRHPLMLSVLGISATGLAAVALHPLLWGAVTAHTTVTQVAPQASGISERSMTLATCLVAAGLLNVAVGGALCLSLLRDMHDRSQRRDELAAALSSRQQALHQLSLEVLDRLEELGVEDVKGSVTSFRRWYTRQMADGDELIDRLQGGSSRPGSDWRRPPHTASTAGSAAEQLHRFMQRLGLTAAELAGMASGEVVSGQHSHGGKHAQSKAGKGKDDQVQGPHQHIKTRRLYGTVPKKKADHMKKERAQLERLMRVRRLEDHHPSFLAYLAEKQELLERCASLVPAQHELSSAADAYADSAGASWDQGQDGWQGPRRSQRRRRTQRHARRGADRAVALTPVDEDDWSEGAEWGGSGTGGDGSANSSADDIDQSK